ncbi:MAG TPA: S8 family serine peptidase [Anaeromyxobacter sp.]|nr:S8 family serine peptidase [Anaeromyxobacter sp.]
MTQLAAVQSEQAAFRRLVATAQIANTREIYGLQRVFNGILYLTDADGFTALRAVPGVKAVHLVKPMIPDNAHAVPLVGATKLWANSSPLHGEGVRIGVIDTGIDYTHANFGGPGTVAAYAAIDPTVVAPGAFPTAKVAGGWDFAGETYDASNTATATPVPDPNPIDGSGHGSHVAGTIAGYGVTAGGATYTGPYDATLDPTTLGIGPGAAPEASLYALKVFGDSGGSTVLAYQAIEWALDPNGDGDPSDHLDMVNLSLGSEYGTSSDAEVTIYTNAVSSGMAVIAAAGNASDVYFIAGAPSTTPAVISVAATQDGTGPAVQVNAPASLAGLKAAGTAAFGPPITTPITADVIAAAPYDGCSALTNGAAIAGRIALIQRGSCTFLAKTQAAAAAGAVAVIIANNQAGLVSMSGTDPTLQITARSVTQADGAAMKAALDASTVVNATLDDTLNFTPNLDQIASFSSRGPTRLNGSIALKPDVAAPGQNIISTAMGTGSGSANYSGTSMATPLVTGVVALLKQLHPTWTPAQLKALLMSSAVHDVFDKPTTDSTRLRVGPGRVGAARIDAAAALATPVIAYDTAAPDQVSVSFQTTDVDHSLTEIRTVTLSNTGASDVTFTPSVDAAAVMPGTSVTVPTGSVTVPAGGSTDVAVTLSADPAQMTRASDATIAATGIGVTNPRQWQSETSGWLVFTRQDGGQSLRLPFYAALTPASQMSTTGQLSTHGAPTGTSELYLVGNGIDTTSLAASPSGVVSLATPFDLAWSAPQQDLGPWNNVSLQHVGVTSNLPDMKTIAAGAKIFFGISTYGVWGSHREVEFDVYLKPSSAPSWEYVLYNTDLGATSTQPGTDVPVTSLVDLSAGTSTAEDFVNGQDASGYFLPAFLTDTIMLPVYAADLGLVDGGDTGIDFQVVTYSANQSAAVDQSPVLHFDLARPAFAVGADPATNLSGQDCPPTWIDAQGATIPVAYDSTREVYPASGILVIHHHNVAGMRAEVVPLVKAQMLVVQTSLPVGSTACPDGGVQITTGYDDNNNGVLDPAEVTSTENVCNGAPGQRGSSGCSSFGAGSLLSLLALGAMFRRRRR